MKTLLFSIGMFLAATGVAITAVVIARLTMKAIGLF